MGCILTCDLSCYETVFMPAIIQSIKMGEFSQSGSDAALLAYKVATLHKSKC